MNAVEIILRFVAVFRRYGVPVTFEPGWETRGNGSSAAYEGGLVHHTVTPISDSRPQSLVTGRPDLSGPLCQFAGLGSGGIHVIAAHPANHAGASGGRSMGPLPVTRLFNPRVVGLEIVYWGTAPMTNAQYRTALVYAIACKEIFGSVERCRAHFETSIEGKIDPAWAANPVRTYDMTQFRRDALALGVPTSGGGATAAPIRVREDDTMIIRHVKTGATALVSGGIVSGISNYHADQLNAKAGGGLILPVEPIEWDDMVAKSRGQETLGAKLDALTREVGGLAAKLTGPTG